MLRLATLALAALGAAATAQQADFTGIQVLAFGVSPSSNSVQSFCGDTFSCTPLQLPAVGGDDVWVTLMGTLGGPYALIGDFASPASLGCVNFGIPGIVNAYMLPFSPLTLTVAAGTITISDRGRCNGGYVAINPALTIPPMLTGFQFSLQGVAGAPLTGGGTGVAFSRTVTITIP
jgi:hypothetical protein